MEKQIDIVMFSMSHYTDWQKGRVNRNFHILNELQKDERIRKIVSVDFLPFNWRKVLKVYGENVIWPMKDLEIVYGDLTSACHQVNSKLFIYSTIDSIYSHKTVVKELRRIFKVLNLQNVVFWSYNPLFTYILEEASRKIVTRQAFVFDAVDNWLAHPAFKKYQTDLKVGYQMIRQDADLIFTVSDSLKNELFSESKKCYWVPNGIDIEHFSRVADNYTVPEELKNIKTKIIGYHGIIQGRVDLEMIKYLARHNPDKSIVMIGASVWRKYRKILAKELGGYKNIQLLPFVSYYDIPRYIQAFDVGIVPHKVDEFTRSMNPLKLYEYTAAGKPVVTTSIAGVETFRNILYTASDYKEFNDKIQLALREDNNNLRQTRLEIVADDSWFGRGQLMTKYLFDILK